MPSPFFIVGAPRTGSTLLRRLLQAHPEVAIPPESGFLAEYLLADHVSLSKRKALFSTEPEFDYWGVRPTAEELAKQPDMISCIRWIHEKYARKKGKRFWGQKTPKLVRTGGIWLDLMPEAKLIHMVRDPRAVANSLRESPYHNLHVIHGAKRYRYDTRLGIGLERDYGSRVMRVSYEDLVADTAGTLRQIGNLVEIDFTGLDNDPNAQMALTPNEEKFGHHRNVDGKVNAGFAARWKEALTEDEVGVVEYLAGDLLTELGYATEDFRKYQREKCFDKPDPITWPIIFAMATKN